MWQKADWVGYCSQHKFKILFNRFHPYIRMQLHAFASREGKRMTTDFKNLWTTVSKIRWRDWIVSSVPAMRQRVTTGIFQSARDLNVENIKLLRNSDCLPFNRTIAFTYYWQQRIKDRVHILKQDDEKLTSFN